VETFVRGIIENDDGAVQKVGCSDEREVVPPTAPHRQRTTAFFAKYASKSSISANALKASLFRAK
jgi:hypothetical protein